MNADQVLDIIYEKYLNNEISKDELLKQVKLIETIEQMFNKEKMPTYSYYCPTHGEFETIRKISERETAPCKDCGKISTKLVDAPSGIQDGYYNQNMSINRIKQPFRTAHR